MARLSSAGRAPLPLPQQKVSLMVTALSEVARRERHERAKRTLKRHFPIAIEGHYNVYRIAIFVNDEEFAVVTRVSAISELARNGYSDLSRELAAIGPEETDVPVVVTYPDCVIIVMLSTVTALGGGVS